MKVPPTTTGVHWAPTGNGILIVDLTAGGPGAPLSPYKVVAFPLSIRSIEATQRPTNLYHPDAIHFL
eukprot:GSA25T00011507001.1